MYYYLLIFLTLIYLFWKIRSNPITKLNEAVLKQDVHKLREILHDGIDPDIHQNDGLTLLCRAICLKNYDIVKLLIDYGADVNWALRKKLSIDFLLNSIDLNCPEITALLINQGAEKGIHYFSFMGFNKKITEVLISNPEMISLEVNGGKNVLHYAVLGGHEKTIQLLVNHGADVNKGNDFTALHQAIKCNNSKLVEILLKHKADHRNITYGLIYAINLRSLKILELLVANGADVNRVFQSGDFPLLAAVKSRDFHIVMFLLEHGANINQKSHFPDSKTVLHIAVSQNSLLMVDLLIHCGANINAFSALGSSPLGLIEGKMNYEKMEKFLIKYGAKSYDSDD
jgi:ankyrin repeat protein